jgi:hypothetical protein
MVNKIMPGIRKSGKGECSKIERGKPPISFPEGDRIKKAPPPSAPIPKKESKAIRMFLSIIGFIK